MHSLFRCDCCCCNLQLFDNPPVIHINGFSFHLYLGRSSHRYDELLLANLHSKGKSQIQWISGNSFFIFSLGLFSCNFPQINYLPPMIITTRLKLVFIRWDICDAFNETLKLTFNLLTLNKNLFRKPSIIHSSESNLSLSLSLYIYIWTHLIYILMTCKNCLEKIILEIFSFKNI